MDWLALIQRGDVEAFNAARSEGSGAVDLFAEELAELQLEGIDLTGAKLDKSDLTGSNLTEANLVRASLEDIDGTGLVLDGVLGMGAKLRGAWLEDADLTGADFSRGDLSGARLVNTKGEGIRLIEARLKDVEAAGAQWPLADLGEATARDADFTGADLSRARLAETKLGGAKLAGANLDGADAAGVKLERADLTGATLRGARLVGASFVGADLSGADLSRADLTKADLSGARLDGANLSGAILVEAAVDGVSALGARFDDADLTGVDPSVLGLAGEALEALAAHGAAFDPDAPRVIDDPAVAVHGARVCVLWTNPDGATSSTLRWAVFGGGDPEVEGVLPVAASAVLATQVVPVSAGFALVVLLDRANGMSLVRWDVSPTGAIAAPRASVLPFEPAVLPVIRGEGDDILVWGLAKRGHAVVVLRDRGEGFELVGNESKPQARGFLGRTHPVLLCKGGVVMHVTARGIGAPVRAPDGFPYRGSVAVPVGARVLIAWGAPSKPREPGGVRVQWLGGRTMEEEEVLTRIPEVGGLDVMPVPLAGQPGALVVWTEDEGPETGTLGYAHLPAPEVRRIEASEPLDGARVVPCHGEGPWLAATTLSGAVVVWDLEGVERARFGGDDA
jgi:uncharacterized protein YjbI with pentapeptide repeats